MHRETVDYKGKIREIADFPKAGVSFKDITTLLQDGSTYRSAVDDIASYARSCAAEVIVGPEARGFVIGGPVAYALGLGFVPVRKPGKLPAETVEIRYQLEYGEDRLSMHRDSLRQGQRVVVVDDLLATGGTVNSTVELVRRLGGDVVGTAFLIELRSLRGRERLCGLDVFSLVQYDED